MTITAPIHPDSTLASLATTFAGAARVFVRHGLDFCCQGQQTLADACRRKDLSVARLLTELQAELQPVPAEERWDDRPIGELIQHILDRYHQGHRAEIPRLVQMADRVEQVHRDKPSCPRGLAAHLRHVAHELEIHMQKEEQILFPSIARGDLTFVDGPIAVMQREHDEHGRNLQRIRDLAHQLVPPGDACGTWRALYLGLAEFEREIMQHIHLENHVLFPRGAGPLTARRRSDRDLAESDSGRMHLAPGRRQADVPSEGGQP